MNRLAYVVLALTLAGPVLAGESVNQKLNADPDGDVVIEVVRGHVSVQGWDKNEVSVQGTRDDDSVDFTVERHGKVINIRDEVEHGFFHGALVGHGTSITVMVPRANGVKASLVSVDADVQGISGPVRIETVSGDIKASNLNGDMQLGTVNGDINAQAGSTRIKLKTVSGDIHFDNTKPIDQAEVSTVSGDVNLDSAIGDDGELTMKSVSGDLNLKLQGQINGRINAQTGPGGRISNSLTEDRPEKSRYVGEQSLKLRLGDGGADISASVVSGEITIAKH